MRSTSPSDLAGKAAFGVIGLMGVSQAVTNLKLDTLSEFVKEAWGFAIPIVIGCAILGVGLWLGNMAKKAVLSSNMENAGTMANVAFGGIMALTGVIALKRMGLAGETVDLGFGRSSSSGRIGLWSRWPRRSCQVLGKES